MTWHRIHGIYVHRGCDVWREPPRAARAKQIEPGWYWDHPGNGHGLLLGPHKTKREACAAAEKWLEEG